MPRRPAFTPRLRGFELPEGAEPQATTTTNVQLDEARRARVEALAAREGLSLSDAVRWALDRWAAEAPEAADALRRVRQADPNPAGRGQPKRRAEDGPPLKLLNVRLTPAEYQLLWRLAEGLELTTRDVFWRALDAAQV